MTNIISSLYFFFSEYFNIEVQVVIFKGQGRGKGKGEERSYEDKLFYLIYGFVNGCFCRQQNVVFLKKNKTNSTIKESMIPEF